MFQAIINKFNKVLAIDQDKLLQDILATKAIDDRLVELNQDQLYKEGIQADGSPTGFYRPFTIAFKKKYGDSFQTPGETGHITGNDTGVTYNSMKVKSEPDGIVITADDRNDFFRNREPKGLGLTKESISQILPYVKKEIIKEIRTALT